jgi:hypothetical protein
MFRQGAIDNPRNSAVDDSAHDSLVALEALLQIKNKKPSIFFNYCLPTQPLMGGENVPTPHHFVSSPLLQPTNSSSIALNTPPAVTLRYNVDHPSKGTNPSSTPSNSVMKVSFKLV